MKLRFSKAATEKLIHNLAIAVVEMAALGGMPDSYWQTDPRIDMAKMVLGEKEFDRARNAVGGK